MPIQRLWKPRRRRSDDNIIHRSARRGWVDGKAYCPTILVNPARFSGSFNKFSPRFWDGSWCRSGEPKNPSGTPTLSNAADISRKSLGASENQVAVLGVSSDVNLIAGKAEFGWDTDGIVFLSRYCRNAIISIARGFVRSAIYTQQPCRKSLLHDAIPECDTFNNFNK
jgi:hypothetical protein